MSKKINTTSIGLFIVAGFALGVFGLLLFSSSKMFTRTREALAYFDESLNGLNEGAPVKYRGVTIGNVKRVMVRFNQATNDFAMPVLLEVQDKLVRERLGDESIEFFTKDSTRERINAGLRASLQTESLVTGLLYVDIRVNPNAPPPVFHQLQARYLELPTEPTRAQQLLNNLASLDIKSIEKNLNSLLAKLDTTVTRLNMGHINEGVTNLLASVNRLVCSPQITNDLAAVHAALEEYRLLAEKLNGHIDPIAGGITNSLAEVNRTLVQFRSAAENLKSMLGPASPVRNNLEQSLAQLFGAAQSLSELLEFLKQHPNAIIAGRELPKTKL